MVSSPGKLSMTGSKFSLSRTSSKNTSDAEDMPLDDALAPPPDDAPDSETGKLRQLLSILRKSLSVADLSSMRLSLPANLLEPIPNLEHWQYCDRPDFFAAMAEPGDDLERMLAVLRWTFTKDLKFVKHKIAKPYNSILGEHFHCHWDTAPVPLNPESHTPEPSQWLDPSPSAEVLQAAGKSASSVNYATSAGSKSTTSVLESSPTIERAEGNSSAASTTSAGGVSSKTATTAVSAGDEQATLAGGSTRVVFLNEQTSHHPPISFFCLESRGPKGTVRCIGADQLSAKFTGTNVSVFPGPFNKGIFVSLPERENEEYQITHPTATVSGLLRGSPYAVIGESTYVTKRGGPGGSRNLRCMIQYQGESWLTKPKFLVEGVIYEYEPGKDSETFTKIKHVPSDKIVANLEGCWRGEVRWKPAGEKTFQPLVDMIPLACAPKTVAPLEEQSELESRKVWQKVTSALEAKQWNEASKSKQALEQAQRVKAEERKKAGEIYKPVYFEPMDHPEREWDGRPHLTEAGLAALDREFSAKWK